MTFFTAMPFHIEGFFKIVLNDLKHSFMTPIKFSPIKFYGHGLFKLGKTKQKIFVSNKAAG